MPVSILRHTSRPLRIRARRQTCPRRLDITQQVAKNFLLTNERSFERKIREALLSFRIEGAYSKEKILELYLQRNLSWSRKLRRRRGQR